MATEYSVKMTYNNGESTWSKNLGKLNDNAKIDGNFVNDVTTAKELAVGYSNIVDGTLKKGAWVRSDEFEV